MSAYNAVALKLVRLDLVAGLHCGCYPEERPLESEVSEQKSRFHLSAPYIIQWGEANRGRRLIMANLTSADVQARCAGPDGTYSGSQAFSGSAGLSVWPSMP